MSVKTRSDNETGGTTARPATNFDSWLVESDNGVVWLRSPLLHRAGFIHAFSTRLGGVSPAPFDSMNLGIADAPGEPDQWNRVSENWRRFLVAVGGAENSGDDLADRQLVRCKQVHGCGVLDADRDPDMVRAAPPFMEGDALVSRDLRNVLAIRVADCVAVLAADARTGAAAAVHAGWRGVAAGIVSETLRKLLNEGSRPQDLLLAIGPCIRQANYQVDAPVAMKFTQNDLGNFIAPDSQDHWKADLPGAIKFQAGRLGIAPAQIDDSAACTHENPRYFFSYRRDGARGGRLAAIISPRTP